MDRPRIAFAGTPDFAVPSLQALIDAGHAPEVVYTQPDRPAGRGRKLRPSPVKACAREHGLSVRQPERMQPSEAEDLRGSDLMVVIAYGQLLPPAVLEAPRLGCVNLHASLLPRWRGAAPIQRAILAGDTETGITLMQMAEGLDDGPMLTRARLPIGDDETAGELHDRLAAQAAEVLRDALLALLAGELRGEPQDDTAATYAPKIRREESILDPHEAAIALHRRIRAFTPPGARLQLGEHDVRVAAAAVDATPAPGDEAPGTILAAQPDGIEIATGEGRLILTEIQPAGGRRQSVADFLNGHKLL